MIYMPNTLLLFPNGSVLKLQGGEKSLGYCCIADGWFLPHITGQLKRLGKRPTSLRKVRLARRQPRFALEIFGVERSALLHSEIVESKRTAPKVSMRRYEERQVTHGNA
jgi:hypothetical protein